MSLRPLLISKFAVYLRLLVAGLVVFTVVVNYGPPTRFVVDPNSSKFVTPQAIWSGVRLVQESEWYILLLMPVSLTIVTVSIFELIKSGVEDWQSYLSHRRRFDEFFGDKASSRGGKGLIILEPTNVPLLLEQISPGIGDRMSSPEENRFFKARNWVNRWDAEGAKAIRELFSKHGFSPPELSHLTRDIDASTPFAFSMGLGFTEMSRKIIRESCSPWLRITISESGDRIELKHQLLNDSVSLFHTSKTSEGKDFKELVPRDWALQEWIDRPEESRDYALILRSTRSHHDGRQVIFILGGFTEHGTAAAGYYLANHWPELWEQHVRGRGYSGGLGDFMILIEGPSDIKDMRLWRQDPNFPAITPELLRDPYHIKCEWSDRLAGSASADVRISPPQTPG